ncbi:Uncharacterised protein [Candidatus Tiddalikarchaeum anstoanum]|nr:Uncharacterised protein [Candidatus Tiddalikarchaeum anstoanum]
MICLDNVLSEFKDLTSNLCSILKNNFLEYESIMLTKERLEMANENFERLTFKSSFIYDFTIKYISATGFENLIKDGLTNYVETYTSFLTYDFFKDIHATIENKIDNYELIRKIGNKKEYFEIKQKNDNLFIKIKKLDTSREIHELEIKLGEIFKNMVLNEDNTFIMYTELLKYLFNPNKKSGKHLITSRIQECFPKLETKLNILLSEFADKYDEHLKDFENSKSLELLKKTKRKLDNANITYIV